MHAPHSQPGRVSSYSDEVLWWVILYGCIRVGEVGDRNETSCPIAVPVVISSLFSVVDTDTTHDGFSIMISGVPDLDLDLDFD